MRKCSQVQKRTEPSLPLPARRRCGACLGPSTFLTRHPCHVCRSWASRCPDATPVICTLFAHIVLVQLALDSQEPSWQSKNTPRLRGSAPHSPQSWLRAAQGKKRYLWRVQAGLEEHGELSHAGPEPVDAAQPREDCVQVTASAGSSSWGHGLPGSSSWGQGAEEVKPGGRCQHLEGDAKKPGASAHHPSLRPGDRRLCSWVRVWACPPLCSPISASLTNSSPSRHMCFLIAWASLLFLAHLI